MKNQAAKADGAAASALPLTATAFRFPERVAQSAWAEHVPFMFWLVDALRPRRFVELGTHNGVSYCAACQAVALLNLDCGCYAVDTWKGDEHAGFYGAEVYADLAAHHDPRYSAFSRLVRSTFDEAVGHFEDGSIDFLHIDGLHSYDAVRHDFETWQPKLAANAVVIFHDTNVRERNFGVFRLWGELSAERRHFEFLHGHGLGVLAMGERYPPAVEALFAAGADEKRREEVRTIFAHLGQAVAQRANAAQTVRQAEEAAAARAADMRAVVEAAFPQGQDAIRDELVNATEIARLRAALAANPADHGALVGLSLALNRANRVAEAIDAIDRAIALQPDAGRYAHLGNLQARMKNWPAARAAMQEAVSRAPEQAVFAERLRQIDAEAGTTAPAPQEKTDS
jgi:tetratricopeptide (TPR) repeat protein